MTFKVVRAPNLLGVSSPLLYLAGPVLGFNWQSQVIRRLRRLAEEKDGSITVANPRAISKSIEADRLFHWEQHYIKKAKTFIFYLPSHVLPEDAHRTSFLLGECLGHISAARDQSAVVVLEQGYPRAGYLEHKLKGSPLVPCRNLFSACVCAFELSMRVPDHLCVAFGGY